MHIRHGLLWRREWKLVLNKNERDFLVWWVSAMYRGFNLSAFLTYTFDKAGWDSVMHGEDENWTDNIIRKYWRKASNCKVTWRVRSEKVFVICLGVFTIRNPPKFEINERLSTSRKIPHLRKYRCTLTSLFHVIYHMLIFNCCWPHDSACKMAVIFKRYIWGGGRGGTTDIKACVTAEGATVA
jgi:hypothetical protein